MFWGSQNDSQCSLKKHISKLEVWFFVYPRRPPRPRFGKRPDFFRIFFRLPSLIKFGYDYSFMMAWWMPYSPFKIISFSCLWINILVKKSTEGGVIKDVLSPITAQRSVDVVQLGEECIWQSREERDHPNQRDNLKAMFLFRILKVKSHAFY